MRQALATEMEILNLAVKQLEHTTGLRLLIEKREARVGNYEVDAILRLGKKKLMAEVKKWAPNTNLGALIDQVKRLPGNGILVADYINPNMVEKLRREKVQFIDTVGVTTHAFYHQYSFLALKAA